MSGFNKTAAALAAEAAGTNATLIGLIYKGHEQYSPSSMYSGELPDLAFNAVAMAIFFVFTLWQLCLYGYFKNNFYGISTVLYLVGQAIGYLGRLLSVSDLSGLSLNNENYFLLQFCSLTISPNFYNAAMYTQYAKVLFTYSTTREKLFRLNVFGKRLQPSLISLFFIATDITCLVIQGIGGGVEGTSLNTEDSNGLVIGNHVFIAGLAIQTFSMSLFALVFTKLCYNIFVRQRLEYISNNGLYERYNIPSSYSVEKSFFAPWRWYKIIKALPLETISEEVVTLNTSYFNKKQARIFKTYPLAIFVAFGFAVIRCIYRLVELSDGGFGGYLITHEHFLVALDFVPLATSALIMCIYSEGLVYTKRGLTELYFIKEASHRGLGAWRQLGCEFRYFFGLKVDEDKLDAKYQQILRERAGKESLGFVDNEDEDVNNGLFRKSTEYRNAVAEDMKSPWWKFKVGNKKMDLEELNDYDEEKKSDSLKSRRDSMEDGFDINKDDDQPRLS